VVMASEFLQEPAGRRFDPVRRGASHMIRAWAVR
jgi:hypothetical protein